MNTLNIFRLVSLIEGLSYLALVGFAMPMKYVWEQPEWVSWFGRAHGFLFIAFVVALVIAAVAKRLGIVMPLVYFILSMIPFGFIAIEHFARQELEAATEAS